MHPYLVWRHKLFIMIFIFSYNRKKMLSELLSELGNRNDIYVIDDGSSFKLDGINWISMQHGGKEGFWKNWDKALDVFKKSNDEFALFLQDDLTDIDMVSIKKYHEMFKDKPYVFNACTDARKNCWARRKPVSISDDLEKIGFVDCIFFANRAAFEKIGYYMFPVSKEWFRKKNISSGVGAQLTKRFTRMNIPIYRRKKSLVRHGNHDSMMHYEERKKTPIITFH